jgi:hypothetical protein
MLSWMVLNTSFSRSWFVLIIHFLYKYIVASLQEEVPVYFFFPNEKRWWCGSVEKRQIGKKEGERNALMRLNESSSSRYDLSAGDEYNKKKKIGEGCVKVFSPG